MRIKIKIGELHMNFDRGRAMSDQQTSESGEEELNLGDHGAGDDCITKVVTYGGNSALIGKSSSLSWCALIRINSLHTHNNL